MQTIDIHNHFFPAELPDLCARFGTPNWPWIRRSGDDPLNAVVMLGDRLFRHIPSSCWDAERRLEEMDNDSVDMQVISATPVLFAYERPAEHALDCAKMFNDMALGIAERGKGRLKSLCQVPLQDIDAACEELTRSMRAGHLGVQIGNHVGMKNLDDAGIITFLQHCASEGAAVLVHPWDMMAGERMPEYMMPWTVAMPAETQLSIVAMILGGGFDQISDKLRICFAHGGGSFAFLLGRLENAWQRQKLTRGKSQYPPSYYLKRFYTDSAVFNEQALRFLVGTMGSDRVLLGSDYPYPLGEERIGALIRNSGLSSQEKKQLLGTNAQEFLGIMKDEANMSVNSARERPVELSSGVDEPMTYSEYLQIPELLSLQRPLSSPAHHDELLFIIVHQTYELWFKQLLHELDTVVVNLKAVASSTSSRDEVYEGARLLRRCTEIVRILVQQFTILETMLPTHFLAFRDKLKTASGFQSEQFRELEFLCGLKDEKMLRHHEPTAEANANLVRRLREPSLSDVFFDALDVMGLVPESSATATQEQRLEARTEAVREIYRHERKYRDWIDICERLTELDELIVGWRLRHIQMVERIIGTRIGTGGSAGSSYLRLTLDKRFFPELWAARSAVIERS